MRLPQRIRGIVLGLITLFVGPFVAAVATSSTTAVHRSPAATATATSGGIQVGSHSHPRIPELAERETPSPTPAPTSAPTVAPRPVVLTVAKPRATPPPAPPVNYPPGSVDAIIMAAAAQYGVDGAWMIRIASCESGERPTAVSSNGMYYGLFQFLPSTFKAHGGTNIFDPTQQATITANMLAHGGARSWPVCSKK